MSCPRQVWILVNFIQTGVGSSAKHMLRISFVADYMTINNFSTWAIVTAGAEEFCKMLSDVDFQSYGRAKWGTVTQNTFQCTQRSIQGSSYLRISFFRDPRGITSVLCVLRFTCIRSRTREQVSLQRYAGVSVWIYRRRWLAWRFVIKCSSTVIPTCLIAQQMQIYNTR